MTICPHCKKSVKGHLDGEKTFRELSRKQQLAAIKQAKANLKKMEAIYASNATPSP